MANPTPILPRGGAGPATTSVQPGHPNNARDGHDGGDGGGGKKKAKRKKVAKACLFCKRSHMTCDDARPCARCIKREIGHLCCDEVVSSSGPNDDPSVAAVPPSAASKATSDPSSHFTGHHHPQTHHIGGPDIHDVILPPPAAGSTSNAGPAPGTAGPSRSPIPGSGVEGFGVTAVSGLPPNASLPVNVLPPQAQALLQRGEPSVNLGASGLALRNQALRNGATFANATLPPSQSPTQPSSFFGSNFSLPTPSDPFGLELGVGVGGVSTYPSAASPRAGDAGFGGGGGLGGNEFSGLTLPDFLKSLDDTSFFNTDALLDHYTGGTSQASSSVPLLGEPGHPNPGAGSSAMSPSFLREDLRALGPPSNTSNGEMAGTGLAGPNASPTFPTYPRSSSASTGQAGPSPSMPPSTTPSLPAPTSLAPPASTTHAASHHHSHKPNRSVDHHQDGSAPTGGSGGVVDPTHPTDKTERFLLTAADQKDGSRDERLAKVIHAKFEAGLLKPYNYVAGYTRLMRWMEQNMSAASRQRVLHTLSEFRPAFRAIASSLTDLDLVFIEEAFERLLLDYDRVFSTMGVPACLWRRTGELFKGNKEMAELVGVPIEMLRDGRLAIYELMAEESAVSYWEKYSSIAFDSGQKAVLTSCVLKNQAVAAQARNKRKRSAAGAGRDDVVPEAMLHCTFSFTVRRDVFSIPSLVIGNFLPLPS